MYPITYVYIDFRSGISFIPMAAITWISSQYLVNTFSFTAILSFFVFSFAVQIVSHYVIEKRKPALMDSLYQSLVLAPFFVWFELAIFPFGYYSDTLQKVE